MIFVFFNPSYRYCQIKKDNMQIDIKKRDMLENNFLQLKITKSISDSLMLGLIHGAKRIQFNILLDKSSKKYFILGISFLNDSSINIASSSIIKLDNHQNDGYFSIDSSSYIIKILDFAGYNFKKIFSSRSPKISDSSRLNHEKYLEKNFNVDEIQVKEFKDRKKSKKITYNYNSESLKGKYYSDGNLFTFQHSSWKKLRKAEKLVEKFKQKGIRAFYYPIEPKPGMGIWYRVRIGPYKKTSILDSLLLQIIGDN